jgi:hypothetical protein
MEPTGSRNLLGQAEPRLRSNALKPPVRTPCRTFAGRPPLRLNRGLGTG